MPHSGLLAMQAQPALTWFGVAGGSLRPDDTHLLWNASNGPWFNGGVWNEALQGSEMRIGREVEVHKGIAASLATIS